MMMLAAPACKARASRHEVRCAVMILTEPAAARIVLDGLLQNYSFEMTAKDVPQLEEAARLIPPDTKIAITFLPNEDFAARVAAAARLRQLGFVPVPHISAR